MDLFAKILGLLPEIVSAIAHVKATATNPAESNRQKAIDIATDAAAALGTVDPAVLNHPSVQATIGAIVDASTAFATTTHAVATGAVVPNQTPQSPTGPAPTGTPPSN